MVSIRIYVSRHLPNVNSMKVWFGNYVATYYNNFVYVDKKDIYEILHDISFFHRYKNYSFTKDYIKILKKRGQTWT